MVGGNKQILATKARKIIVPMFGAAHAA